MRGTKAKALRRQQGTHAELKYFREKERIVEEYIQAVQPNQYGIYECQNMTKGVK